MSRKSHSGTKKRFKVTATGKVKARACGRIHNTGFRDERRMRETRKGMILEGRAAKKIRTLLGSAE